MSQPTSGGMIIKDDKHESRDTVSPLGGDWRMPKRARPGLLTEDSIVSTHNRFSGLGSMMSDDLDSAEGM